MSFASLFPVEAAMPMVERNTRSATISFDPKATIDAQTTMDFKLAVPDAAPVARDVEATIDSTPTIHSTPTIPDAALVTGSLSEVPTQEAYSAEPGVEQISVAEVPVAEVPVAEGPVVEVRRQRLREVNVQVASLAPFEAVDEQLEQSKTAKAPGRAGEAIDECFGIESCVDDYLWSLYEKTPKVDTNKVVERVKKTVKKKGKMRTVMAAVTKYVVGDFTWKDPAAAQKVGMPLKEYVIGGMDRKFKFKLYRALRAMDGAGLMPGITSAFRDDYRQAIATGNKASSDSSYHGGSRRGGYGHGLAADLVSLKGETRLERYASSDRLWKWIDAHEKELGIGRPYRDRDPPHVGPIDGKEFSVKRALASAKKAAAKMKKAATAKVEIKKHPLLNEDKLDALKRARPEKSASKVSALNREITAQH